ncbi:hypothetical protein QR680_010003 [Steinernema hermaphroditum]|uniref:Uncharacterized protein n=1 Tax=Steinernema hermaphroditum TaxID=289476 RepID=A0AA39MAF6_9BILA|nr:hypothetical protein QR680_010003 [Steinernema hermaphroditum]
MLHPVHPVAYSMVFYIENLEDLYPSTRARIAFGVVYIALAVIAIPVYTLIITIYLRNKTFRKWPCYWIMSVMGVFDVLYLCAEIFMAIMGSVYSGSVIMVFLLAANRFFVLVLSRFFTVPPVFYKICIVSTFVYVAALFGISLSPKADIQYEPLFLMLRADTEKGWIGFLTDMDGYVGFVCFGSTFLMYVIITGYLILQRTQSTNYNLKKELKVLVQGIFIFLLGLFILLNRDVIAQRIFLRYWYTASLNVVWIFYCGLFNPLLYLITNR